MNDNSENSDDQICVSCKRQDRFFCNNEEVCDDCVEKFCGRCYKKFEFKGNIVAVCEKCDKWICEDCVSVGWCQSSVYCRDCFDGILVCGECKNPAQIEYPVIVDDQNYYCNVCKKETFLIAKDFYTSI